MALHDTTYLWGVSDTLQTLGIKGKQIENLSWIKRLNSTNINAGAYEKLPSPEEASEMQEAVLKVNPKPTIAND